MQRDKRNNKESEGYNRKTTRGRNTIRSTKSETPKSGDRPSTSACNCGRTICSADRSCGKGTCADRREMDEATTMTWGNNKET